MLASIQKLDKDRKGLFQEIESVEYNQEPGDLVQPSE